MANRYLQGNFGPVSEEVTVTELPVTGTLPGFLDGRYLRNGPNPIDADPATYHWFSGHGMVHGVRLRDGKAQWYRNRYVRSQDVATALGEEWTPGAEVHFQVLG
jgi:carotenoid cleavage dioxygenase